jgi:hypothetical protein
MMKDALSLLNRYIYHLGTRETNRSIDQKYLQYILERTRFAEGKRIMKQIWELSIGMCYIIELKDLETCVHTGDSIRIEIAGFFTDVKYVWNQWTYPNR